MASAEQGQLRIWGGSPGGHEVLITPTGWRRRIDVAGGVSRQSWTKRDAPGNTDSVDSDKTNSSWLAAMAGVAMD